MNKQKLLVVAVAGALAAPGLALAQSANVTMYGLADLRWDQSRYTTSTLNTAANPQVNALTKQHLSGGQANYIGFRGSEDLGGGMSVFFQVESQFFIDARPDVSNQAHTNALFGGRPTFLGLRSTSWGEVSGGYQDSTYKDVQRVWSVGAGAPFAGIMMGNGNTTGSLPSPNCVAGFASGSGNLNATATTTNCAEAPGNATSFNRTVSDTLVYRSPVFGGARLGAMLAINEFKTPTVATAANTQTNPSLQAYSVSWSGGPFSAAGGYEVHRGFRSATNATTASTADNNAKDTGITLGGKWNYGAGNVGLGWERLAYGNAAATAATANDFKTTTWVLQADYNVSSVGRLYGGYAKNNGRKACGAGLGVTATTSTALATCGGDLGGKQWTFGYDHSLSKRTTLYAYYSKIDNNSAGTFAYPSDSRTTNASTLGGAAGAGSAILGGVDQTSINLGMKHTF